MPGFPVGDVLPSPGFLPGEVGPEPVFLPGDVEPELVFLTGEVVPGLVSPGGLSGLSSFHPICQDIPVIQHQEFTFYSFFFSKIIKTERV